eukprot:scaffold50459_cov60-Phaeocystis_antarctica.AAC.1
MSPSVPECSASAESDTYCRSREWLSKVRSSRFWCASFSTFSAAFDSGVPSDSCCGAERFEVYSANTFMISSNCVRKRSFSCRYQMGSGQGKVKQAMPCRKRAPQGPLVPPKGTALALLGEQLGMVVRMGGA